MTLVRAATAASRDALPLSRLFEAPRAAPTQVMAHCWPLGLQMCQLPELSLAKRPSWMTAQCWLPRPSDSKLLSTHSLQLQGGAERSRRGMFVASTDLFAQGLPCSTERSSDGWLLIIPRGTVHARVCHALQ